ncbi:MAG TPA: hypothetical protein VFA23_08435 [Dongiaceae bacterium]|jgi:hypothetical protein|nr:hypothetical protein [Dongiaceae bacterium]
MPGAKPPPPRNDAEANTDDAIAAAKLQGATTARQAAEMTLLRSLSDEEWERIRAIWDRRWF